MTLHFDERGHLNDEGVALYVDALKLERTNRLPEPLREHVAGCQECRAQVTGLFSLLAREPTPGSHPTLGRASMFRSIPPSAYRIAALIIAAVGIGVLAYFSGRPAGETEQAPQVAMPAPQAADSTGTPGMRPEEREAPKAIAADFRPNEELEGLVGSELRGESFDVTSPGERSERRAITFRWKTAGSGPWKVVLLDNNGDLVRAAEVRSTPFILDGPFKPGLYYWKVIQDDELAHVGKLRVE